MAPSIKVLIVDDHVIFCEGLKSQLEADGYFQVVALANTAEAAVDLAVQHQPDIVLMDVEMPGLSPFSAASTINNIIHRTRIVFLSAFDHDFYIEQALKAKAWGFLVKHESTETVRNALLDVARGSVCFSRQVRSRIIADVNGLRLAPRSATVSSLLSTREIETLSYIARGLSTKEISEVMSISAKTVENHKTHLMSKLNIHDRVHLTRYAIREGIVNP